jgi:hypothetical protein
MPRRLAPVTALASSVFALAHVHAQTCPGFQTGGPTDPGISDSFSAYVQPILKFNDRLFFAGAFSAAGTVTTNVVASYDPVANSWSALSGGVNLGNTNGFGAALAQYSIAGTPRLILGGGFANVRNGAANVPDTTSLAAWDGASWSSLATGWAPATGRSVWTLLPWPQPNGSVRLVAGGGWPNIGAATADGIAFFDGTAWQNIGGPSDTGISGPFSPVAFCSAIFNNQLFIGGRFSTVNGVAAPLIARWSGTAWSRPGSLSAPTSFSDISSLHVWNDGTGAKLYAGGSDISVGGQSTSVAAWNGSVWQRVGQNLGGRTTSLANYDDGTGDRLYGGWTADAQEKYLYRLESNVWTAVNNGVSVALTGYFPSIFGLRVIDNSLYVGGNFQLANGLPSYGIARYAPCGPVCNDIDFNNDGSFFDPTDVDAFFSVFSEGPCIPATASCDPIDFNNDGSLFDPDDIDSFFSVFSEGPCL